MMVVIANDLPNAVRGRLKCWFVEPKPGVFISGIKDALAKNVVEYLFANCTEESGLMIFCGQSTLRGTASIRLARLTASSWRSAACNWF